MRLARRASADCAIRDASLEAWQRRLGTARDEPKARKIEQTLETSSKLFELMQQRLENLEEGQQTLVEGQRQVIARLDRLVEMGRERTEQAERLGKIESRLDALERRVPPSKH